ncbi:MAG TPA: ABC transporter substrate-binding protein [Candidatus Baltobacteraceae bacterium]
MKVSCVLACLALILALHPARPLAAETAPAHVAIAYQPGLGYAPLLIIKQNKWIEKDFPGTTVEWRELSNGATIRDGIISNTLQVGVVGTAPWIVGWARGVPWKLLACASNMDMWLNVMDPNIKSLKDLKAGDQIALPAPDSIQAFALRKGAQEILGNAHALDTNMVAMAHPLGLQALVSHQVVGHLTAPPFEYEEIDRGAHTIFNTHDVMGDTCFTAVTMPTAFASQYPAFTAKLLGYMQQADKMLKSSPADAAKYIADAESKPDLAAQYRAWLGRPGIAYTVTPSGFLKYATFMKQIGSIDKVPSDIKELEFPALAPLGGS